MFVGADAAKPAAGVLEALAEADVVLLAPSNPVVSIAPSCSRYGAASTAGPVAPGWGAAPEALAPRWAKVDNRCMARLHRPTNSDSCARRSAGWVRSLSSRSWKARPIASNSVHASRHW